MSSLRGSEQNGIRSQGLGFSNTVIKFEKLDSNKEQIKEGTKLDWKRGKFFVPIIVKGVKDKSPSKILDIFIEGELISLIKLTVNYPDPNVFPCGTKIIDRDCRSEEDKKKNSNKPKKLESIRIKFATAGFAEAGSYYLDSGKVYGGNELAYGKS